MEDWQPPIGATRPDHIDAGSGEKFPAWKNDCLIGALAGQEVRRLRVTDRKVVEQETILRDMGRVRDVKCGPDGTVYVVLNGPDKLVKLVPSK